MDPFVPRKGVQIETDPKATSVGHATAMGDDEGAIEALIRRLQVRQSSFGDRSAASGLAAQSEWRRAHC